MDFSSITSHGSDSLNGAEIIALVLERFGIEIVYGVVGIPIVELAETLQTPMRGWSSFPYPQWRRLSRIRFIAMRNEQSASYAASIMAYMTCSRTYPMIIPGVCLTVSGPGMVHALAGMANSHANLWPMIVLSGAPEQDTLIMGGFQEADQLSLAKAVGCLFAERVTSVRQIPRLLYHAFRMAIHGPGGPSFVELPADILRSKISFQEFKVLFGADLEMYIQPLPIRPSISVTHELIENTIQMLLEARRPLLIVGKGCAFACAEESLRRWVKRLHLPFLPMPMGKGVLSDNDEWCMSAARSLALKTSDLIILVGARLNWMLEFGRTSKFAKDCRFIQIDRQIEVFHVTRHLSIALHGDIRIILDLLEEHCEGLSIGPLKLEVSWLNDLHTCSVEHQELLRHLCENTSSSLNYHRALSIITSHIEKDAIWIIEGANTMDVSRSFVKHEIPRCRFDAGTFGTMGIGFGYAISAALCFPRRRIVCLQGDSAFGFSAMEMETVMRYRLNIIFIIINNNGIYRGLNEESFQKLQNQTKDNPFALLPSTLLLPGAQYEKIAEAFGGVSLSARTDEELTTNLKRVLSSSHAAILNVHIDPESQAHYPKVKYFSITWISNFSGVPVILRFIFIDTIT